MTFANFRADRDATQASNVVHFPSPQQLERWWQAEADLRAQAARARTGEEMRALHGLRFDIMRALKQFDPKGEFDPDRDPDPAPMSDAEVTKIMLGSPYPKWQELGRTGKWRRVPSDVTEREDSRDDDEAPAKGQRLPFHPAADKFPLMNEAELKALAEDIKAHGLNEGIETLDGMVLDGRNRYNACLMIDFDLTNRIHALSDNTNPHDHLISKNLMRRQSTKLERAVYAARMVTVEHGGDRKSGSSRQNDGLIFITAADAACRIGVSQIAVERAGFILSHCVDEVIAAIDAGIDWLTLGFANKLAHASDEDQRLWLKDNKHVIKPVKRAARPPRVPIPWTKSQLKGAPRSSSPCRRRSTLMPKANHGTSSWRAIVIIDLREPEADRRGA